MINNFHQNKTFSPPEDSGHVADNVQWREPTSRTETNIVQYLKTLGFVASQAIVPGEKILCVLPDRVLRRYDASTPPWDRPCLACLRNPRSLSESGTKLSAEGQVDHYGIDTTGKLFFIKTSTIPENPYPYMVNRSSLFLPDEKILPPTQETDD